MSSGIARRRAAKAARRKKLLAERRKLADAGTRSPLAEQMRRLAAAPLHACLVQEGLFERGNGMVILARKTGAGGLAVGAFLIDVYCLGVKDIVFRQAVVSEIEAFVAAMGETAPFASVDPSYARKLLRDLVAWARSIGIEPHADYAAVELLFGESLADACTVSFRFGHDGKPLYVSGPDDTPAQIRRRIEHLRRRLGDGGFGFLTPEDDGDDDFEAEETPDYDPADAPDPTEWLALDEDERLSRVEDYHQRAGVDLPNHRVHAVFHVIVENQIALGDELPVRRAVERLMAGGLERHEALHAVASALAEHVYDVAHDEATSRISHDAYFAAVERLTVESWRRKLESDDEANAP